MEVHQLSDDQARQWYFDSGSETARCSGSIDDYDGKRTMPAVLRDIQAEEDGMYQADALERGLGPQRQVTRR
jgi:hypothetical protein